MIEFNPDGSIKLPDRFAKKKEEEQRKFQTTACMRITKDVVSDKPKKCHVTLELSPRFLDNRFVNFIFKQCAKKGETPMKIEKKSEKQFLVQVGSSFRRCSECTSLIKRYQSYNEGQVILKQGNCPYEVRNYVEFNR